MQLGQSHLHLHLRIPSDARMGNVELFGARMLLHKLMRNILISAALATALLAQAHDYERRRPNTPPPYNPIQHGTIWVPDIIGGQDPPPDPPPVPCGVCHKNM